MVEKKPGPQERNNLEHIKWLIAAVKELQWDRDSDRAELRRLRGLVERKESE